MKKLTITTNNGETITSEAYAEDWRAEQLHSAAGMRSAIRHQIRIYRTFYANVADWAKREHLDKVCAMRREANRRIAEVRAS